MLAILYFNLSSLASRSLSLYYFIETLLIFDKNGQTKIKNLMLERLICFDFQICCYLLSSKIIQSAEETLSSNFIKGCLLQGTSSYQLTDWLPVSAAA